jgi:hypothetical protein
VRMPRTRGRGSCRRREHRAHRRASATRAGPRGSDDGPGSDEPPGEHHGRRLTALRRIGGDA